MIANGTGRSTVVVKETVVHANFIGQEFISAMMPVALATETQTQTVLPIVQIVIRAKLVSLGIPVVVNTHKDEYMCWAQ